MSSPVQKKNDCPISDCLASNPALANLIYWRNPFNSACVFVAGLSFFISLATLSLISVVAYLSMALLCCTGGWCLNNKLSEYNRRRASTSSASGDASTAIIAPTHPLDRWLSSVCKVESGKIELPQEQVIKVTGQVVNHLQDYANYIRCVIVVENYLDTIKFAAGMYLLARIGAWMNLLTLITLGFIGLFTLPKVYELNQSQIDKLYAKARSQFDKHWTVIRDKLQTLPVIGEKLKTN